MRFVIFLDVDGVLNTRTTVQRTPEGYRGIDDARVKVLADAIKKYGGADIVLTSDWKDMRPESEDLDYPHLWERLLTTNGIERAKAASACPAVETIIFQSYIEEVS